MLEDTLEIIFSINQMNSSKTLKRGLLIGKKVNFNI